MPAMPDILVIPDIHEPWSHPKALQFSQDVQRVAETDETVFIGDITDLHSVGRFHADPDGFSAGKEYEAAKAKVAKWHDAFPNAKVCIGNHDERIYRRAFESGIPRSVLKDWNSMWGTPTWDWAESHQIAGIKFVHGTCNSGMTAALRLAKDSRQSIVMGHTHTFAGVQWDASDKDIIFGMNVGCLIDITAYSMAYARHFRNRPCLGVGVIRKGTQPIWIPMPCGDGQPYNRDAKGLSYTKRVRSLNIG